MKLPAKFQLREVFHGHGRKGYATYGYLDTEGLGIGMTATRQNGREAFVETWTFEWLEGEGFATYAALRERVEQLTDEAIAAEQARWPVSGVDADLTSHNRCRLCPRNERKLATSWATVRRAWTRLRLTSAPVCDEHAELAKDPAALLAAIEAEVAERMARPSPLLDALTKSSEA